MTDIPRTDAPHAIVALTAEAARGPAEEWPRPHQRSSKSIAATVARTPNAPIATASATTPACARSTSAAAPVPVIPPQIARRGCRLEPGTADDRRLSSDTPDEIAA